jgi:hypothetical protein
MRATALRPLDTHSRGASAGDQDELETPTPTSPPVGLRMRNSSPSSVKMYEIGDDKILAGSQALSPREIRILVEMAETKRTTTMAQQSPKPQTSIPVQVEQQEQDSDAKSNKYTRMRIIALFVFLLLGLGLILVWLLNPFIQADISENRTYTQSDGHQSQLALPTCTRTGNSYTISARAPGIGCLERLDGSTGARTMYSESSSPLSIPMGSDISIELYKSISADYNCMDWVASVRCK